MQENKQFKRELAYCLDIFNQITQAKHRFFSRQMVHNLCYILHHHFILTIYESEMISEYLAIFVQEAKEQDLELLADAIRSYQTKGSISKQIQAKISKKLPKEIDQEKVIKISSFYPSAKSKNMLIQEVSRRYQECSSFYARCGFVLQIMERVQKDPDLYALLQGKSGELQNFIDFYVLPVIYQAHQESDQKQVQALKLIVENITGSPLPLQKQKSHGEGKKKKNQEYQKQNKQYHQEGKFKKKDKKFKEKQSLPNFGKIKSSLEFLLVAIQSDAVTKNEVNQSLSRIYDGELPEKMQEQLFRFLEEKVSGKIGLIEVGVLKKLMKGIRNQGWVETFRLKIIQDKLKKFSSKQVYRGIKEDEKELGRVSHKLKTESGYVPKFIRRLEKEMMEVFEQNRSYDRQKAVSITLKRIEESIHELKDTAQEVFVFTLQPFGSYVNHFNMFNSDIDVAIACRLNRKEQISLLEKLAFHLNQKRYAHNIEVITLAKVPIIRFTDSITSVSIDLSCNNLLGTVNSQLINAYRRFDERVHILGIALKAILKRYEILGNGSGLSSYAYILMLIAFLQNTSPPILPNLQSATLIAKDASLQEKEKTMEFQKDGQKVTSLNIVYSSDLDFALQNGLGQEKINEKFASQLLYLFFHFYTYEFKHDQTTISIREGGFKPKANADEKFLFSIEDPFDPTNNPGKLVKNNSPLSEKLLKKFILIMKRIRQNQTIFN